MISGVARCHSTKLSIPQTIYQHISRPSLLSPLQSCVQYHQKLLQQPVHAHQRMTLHVRSIFSRRGTVSNTPTETEASLFAKIDAHLQKAEFVQAEPYLLRVLEMSPDSLRALIQIASVKLGTLKYQEAIEYAEKALTLKPNWNEALTVKAVCFQNMNRFDEALRIYDDILKVEPNMLQAILNKGIVLVAQSKFAEAEVMMDRVLHATLPTTSLALLQKAIILTSKSKFDESAAAFDQVLVLTPGNLVAMSLKANCDIHRHKYGEAQEMLEKVLAINPNDENAKHVLQKLEEARGSKK